MSGLLWLLKMEKLMELDMETISARLTVNNVEKCLLLNVLTLDPIIWIVIK